MRERYGSSLALIAGKAVLTTPSLISTEHSHVVFVCGETWGGGLEEMFESFFVPWGFYFSGGREEEMRNRIIFNIFVIYLFVCGCGF